MQDYNAHAQSNTQIVKASKQHTQQMTPYLQRPHAEKHGEGGERVGRALVDGLGANGGERKDGDLDGNGDKQNADLREMRESHDDERAMDCERRRKAQRGEGRDRKKERER
jgi:hypothetical protein